MNMGLLMGVTLLMTIVDGQGPSSTETRFAVSGDGTRLAYDITGSGPTLILLHGGGQTRRVWHDAGYVARLATEFRVVTMDLRGQGESDKPDTVDAYSIDRLTGDVLAVADAVGAPRFTLWGFSYGANVGRYAALRSDRVQAMVYIGIPFGPAAEGAFRQMILDLRSKWMPVIEADRQGRLEVSSLSEGDQAT